MAKKKKTRKKKRYKLTSKFPSLNQKYLGKDSVKSYTKKLKSVV